MISEAIERVYQGSEADFVAGELLQEYTKIGAGVGAISGLHSWQKDREKAAATGQKKPGVFSLAKRVAVRGALGAAAGAAAKKYGKPAATSAWSWGKTKLGAWKGQPAS